MTASTMHYRAIGDPGLITVLASPVRQEIVDSLAALGGEGSAADLAQQLGRHADGLYYHLKVLCMAKLVVALDGHDGEERRYRLAGHAKAPLRLAYSVRDERHVTALRKFAHGLMQVAEHDFVAALELPGIVVTAPGRQLWAARSKGWLKPHEVEEVNVLLERLCALMSQPRTEERDQLFSCTFAFAPHVILPKRRGEQDA